jgi:transcriptional regulator with XRE-family HTH domain
VGFKQNQSTQSGQIGAHLTAARLQQGLSQSELAARCALSQAQISYFELGQRQPTLSQLIHIARALDISLERLIAGTDRPGTGLRDIAIELRRLGLVDLWVDAPVVPIAFRRPEEVVAQAVSGREPDPRIIEAIPAILAWNRFNPILLRAYGQTVRPRVTRRLAWLADVVLVIDRRGGFPGGCRKEQLIYFTQKITVAPPGSDDWDSLGRPMTRTPTSPIWKRWRISYDADLEQFEQRARHLDALRKNSDGRRERRACRRSRIVRGPQDDATSPLRQAGIGDAAEHSSGLPERSTCRPITSPRRGALDEGHRDGE